MVDSIQVCVDEYVGGQRRSVGTAEDGGNWEARIIHSEPYTYTAQGLRSVLANEKDGWREGDGTSLTSLSRDDIQFFVQVGFPSSSSSLLLIFVVTL